MIETLDKIKNNPIGLELLKGMHTCQKNLLIYDDKSSLSAGGYTAAVRTSTNVFTPGKGESAYIRFRFDQPSTGSHLVKTQSGEIPFTYVDNVFHELVHNKHTMCGTLSQTGAEAQAIAEENVFRRSRPETANWPERDFRKYEEGKQIWFGHFLRR